MNNTNLTDGEYPLSPYYDDGYDEDEDRESNDWDDDLADSQWCLEQERGRYDE